MHSIYIYLYVYMIMDILIIWVKFINFNIDKYMDKMINIVNN